LVSAQLLSFAAEAYGFDASTLRFVSSSTNEVYQFRKGDRPYILRFAQRPVEWVSRTIAEMDWLDYLSRQGIGVSLPLRSASGALVVATEDDGKPYILAAFSMANGRFWDKNDPSRWNAAVFHAWGKLMGDMHRLTKAYVPANVCDVRDTFAERETIPEKLKACPTVYRLAQDTLREILALPVDKDSYGLIHYDLHPWNFYLDGERIYVFDFDDCLYGWFALDIGVALYHGLWWGRRDDAKPVPHDYANSIISNFLAGYLSGNALSSFWLSKIPLFMRYRQICKFSWFFDPSNVSDEQKTRIHNLERGVLFTGYVMDEALFR